jgi:predicted enzyme related to lactoylglutathione lyase
MSNHHATAVLYTVHLRSIAHFYEQVVGMRVRRADGDHVVLEKNRFRFIIHQIPEKYAANIRIGNPPKVRESGAIKLSLPVASIANSRQVAAQLGGRVFDADREWDYEGSTVCDGWDPDGNVFQLFQREGGRS